MEPLKDLLLTEARRPRLLADTVRLVDAEMASKRGLRSVPLKGAYKLVTGFRPGFVPAIVDAMLPEFCEALQPYYADWLAEGEGRATLEATLKRRERQVSDALLKVADRRVDNATMPGAGAIKKAYKTLRGTAQEHVSAALPGLGRTVAPYLREAGVGG